MSTKRKADDSSKATSQKREKVDDTPPIDDDIGKATLIEVKLKRKEKEPEKGKRGPVRRFFVSG